MIRTTICPPNGNMTQCPALRHRSVTPPCLRKPRKLTFEQVALAGTSFEQHGSHMDSSAPLHVPHMRDSSSNHGQLIVARANGPQKWGVRTLNTSTGVDAISGVLEHTHANNGTGTTPAAPSPWGYVSTTGGRTARSSAGMVIGTLSGGMMPRGTTTPQDVPQAPYQRLTRAADTRSEASIRRPSAVICAHVSVLITRSERARTISSGPT